MADEAVATPAPVDESFGAFFKAGNDADAARDRGEAPAVETPTPDISDEELTTKAEETEKPDPKKIDGRTLEGRRQKIYQQVEELTTQRHQTQREVEATRAELARLREEMAQLKPQTRPQQTPQAQPQEDFEPKLEQFAKLADGSDNPDPYTSWMRETQRWEARQAARESQREMQMRAEQVHEHQTWEAKVDAAEKTTPGLREKLRTATVPIHRDTLPYIKRHPMGADIAAYLVDHPDIAQRLVTLHPVEQIGQIGEIVGELKTSALAAKSGSAAPIRPVSQARAPIQPLGTSPVASSPEPEENESLAQFVRRNNALDRKAGRL